MITKFSPIRFISALTVVIFLASGCAHTGGKGSGAAQISSVSGRESEELRIGATIHEHIVSMVRLYTKPEVLAYMRSIGTRLAAETDREDLSYKFYLIVDDRIYSTAAPGGYVYVTTGLVAFCENEAEFAGVLAHELGQLQYKDPRLSTAKKVLSTITKIGTMVGPLFGNIGAVSAVGLSLLDAATDLKSRAKRAFMADEKALEYMVRAGFDPQGLVDFVRRLVTRHSKGNVRAAEYIDSRSVDLERLDKLTDEFAELDLRGMNFDTHRKEYISSMRGVRVMYEARG